MTVQLDEKNFGFVEMCEITDEVQGNCLKMIMQKQVLAARIIDFDKNGKIQLSTRESVVSSESWKNIRPEGPSIRFQEQDGENQKRGNLRNKILKFGA